MKTFKFKKYHNSMMEYDDYKHILDEYMGEEKLVGKLKNGEDAYLRDKGCNNLSNCERVNLLQDIADCFMEKYEVDDCYSKGTVIYVGDEEMKYDGNLYDDVLDHWSDVIADWVTEDECSQMYVKNNLA